jgi:hypothetical protein
MDYKDDSIEELISDMSLFNKCIDEGKFIFIPGIYDRFRDSYKESNSLYKAFIKSKNLGVMPCVSILNEALYKKDIHSDYYYVTNEKMWLYSKLRYGF